MHRTLKLDDDRATIDALWNRFFAAWFEGGKDDPKLALSARRGDGRHLDRPIEPRRGIKLLLGADPKKDNKDKVAKVDLRSLRYPQLFSGE